MAQTSVDEVFRDFNTPGNPASGEYKPEKPRIRALLKQIQNAGGQSVTRNTYAALSGVTPPTENYMGIVLNDPDPTKNGYYARVSGAWVWERGFPDSFTVFDQTGGTANALQLTAATGVNPGDVVAGLLVPDASNTGATTIAINGDTAVPLLSAAGSPLAAGELVAGKATIIAKIGDDWRVILAFSQFSFRKAWDSATTYVADDIVESGGSLWLALTSNTNSTPTEGADWTLFLPGVTVADGSVGRPKIAATLSKSIMPSVFEFGAVGDGVANDSAAFTAAQDEAIASGVNAVLVPGYTYNLDSPVEILDGVKWIFDGANLTHTDETKDILVANGKADWAILGRLKITGTLVSAATAAEIGLHITGGKRYRVEGVVATNFKGVGIQVDGASITPVESGNFRGDRGVFADCATHRNTKGLYLADGAGAEYLNFTNFQASGNTQAVHIDAGNATFLGGNIVDNTNGVLLTGVGVNHGHGIFVGTNINHNTSSNLKADSVTRGYTFLACHIYGNATETSSGNIWLLDSAGILIEGGVIDTWIYNDDSGNGKAGINRIVGNYLPTNYEDSPQKNTLLKTNTTGALEKLEVLENWTKTGAADINSPRAVYVLARRTGTSQSSPSGSQTTIIFNTQTEDTEDCYDTTTGQFTCPVAGVYRMKLNLVVGGTSLTAGFGGFQKNGSSVSFCAGGVANSGATTFVASGSCDMVCAAGDVLTFISAPVGTSPTISVNSTQMTIELLE